MQAQRADMDAAKTELMEVRVDEWCLLCSMICSAAQPQGWYGCHDGLLLLSLCKWVNECTTAATGVQRRGHLLDIPTPNAPAPGPRPQSLEQEKAQLQVGVRVNPS